MSFENKNLYHLLGNDVEDDETPSLPPREIVKKNTSSKKADVPPPSVDPSKAKKKSKPTGNEGAFRNKSNNKAVTGPSSTPTRHQRRPFDRHSQTGKVDSKKKIRQGWGSDDKRELEAETEGLADAVEELEVEAGVTPDDSVAAKKSLQDYFAELQLKQQELDGVKQIRKANEGSEDKWTATEKIEKEQESFVESSIAKKSKSKSAKEKKFLDIEASFADEKPSRFESRRGGFKKGGKKGGNGKTSAPKKPAVNDQNFPSL